MNGRKRILRLGKEGNLVLRAADGKEIPATLGSVIQPVAYLLIDCSGSMAGDKLVQARCGALDFAKSAMTKGYSVGVIRFDGAASLLSTPQPILGPLEQALSSLSAGGSTNMSAALDLALLQLLRESGHRAIALVTDGQPDSQEATLVSAKKATTAGVQVIAIGTDDADVDFLRQLSSADDLAIFVGSHQLREGIASAARLLTSPSKRV